MLILWEDEKAVEELEASLPYRQTVEVIVGSVFLAADQSVGVFEVYGGQVLADELAARLG